jgi:hypothetical protein
MQSSVHKVTGGTLEGRGLFTRRSSLFREHSTHSGGFLLFRTGPCVFLLRLTAKMKNPGDLPGIFVKVWIVCRVHTNLYLSLFQNPVGFGTSSSDYIISQQGKPPDMKPACESNR